MLVASSVTRLQKFSRKIHNTQSIMYFQFAARPTPCKLETYYILYMHIEKKINTKHLHNMSRIFNSQLVFLQRKFGVIYYAHL